MSEESPSSPQSPGEVQEHPAVRLANRFSDYVVFWITVVMCIAILGVVALFGAWAAISSGEMSASTDASGLPWIFLIIIDYATWILLAAAVLIVMLVSIRMMRQMYLANALQVEYSEYAWLRDWSNLVAKDLHMPEVEIMVTQDPVMNAFAFGFMKPYTIVLNSGTVRWTSDDELKAIVVHEMAHIKYKHTAMSTYSNIFRVTPVFGSFFGWLLDFWSRRCEFTADRLALAYLNDKTQVKDALICIHVGPDVAAAFNTIAQQWQAYKTNNTFNQFTQTFSSHPFLSRRLHKIEEFYDMLHPTIGAAKTFQKDKEIPKKESDGTDS